MTTAMEKEQLKDLIKTAFSEVLEERRDLLHAAVEEALEDVALVRAIEDGETSDLVDRDEVMAILEGRS